MFNNTNRYTNEPLPAASSGVSGWAPLQDVSAPPTHSHSVLHPRSKLRGIADVCNKKTDYISVWAGRSIVARPRKERTFKIPHPKSNSFERWESLGLPGE